MGNKKQLVSILFSGIKCDNPECNWKDDTVKQEEYPQYVNKPCPCCGENLMTEECFKEVQKAIHFTNRYNRTAKLICRDYYKAHPEKRQDGLNSVALHAECDKNGKMTEVSSMDTYCIKIDELDL